MEEFARNEHEIHVFWDKTYFPVLIQNQQTDRMSEL